MFLFHQLNFELVLITLETTTRSKIIPLYFSNFSKFVASNEVLSTTFHIFIQDSPVRPLQCASNAPRIASSTLAVKFLRSRRLNIFYNLLRAGAMYNRYNSSSNQLPYGESAEPSAAIKQFDLRSHYWGTGAGGHHQRVQPLQRRSVRKTAVVGGSVVLDCDLPLDQQHPYPHQPDQHQHRENEPGQLPQDATAGAAASAAAATLAERLPPMPSLDDVDELDPDVDDPDLTNRHSSAGHMIKWHKQGIEVGTMFPLHLPPAARRR